MRLKRSVSALDGNTIGSPVTYGSSRRDFVGSEMVAMGKSHLQRRHVHPASLGPALEPELGELHALGALHEIVAPRRIGDDVTDEILPLDLEAVVVDDVVRHL